MLPSASRDKSVTRLHCAALLFCLQQVFFDGYNRKFAVDASHEAVNWPECEERVEAFKRQHIYQSMIDTEITSMSYPHIPRLPACRILTCVEHRYRLRCESGAHDYIINCMSLTLTFPVIVN